jgi:hypothetical protein
MSAASSCAAASSTQSHLEYWVGDRSAANVRLSDGAQDKADISSLAKRLAAKTAQAQGAKADGSEDDPLDGLPDKDKQKLLILEDFLYRLTGRHYKFRYLKIHDLRADEGAPQPNGFHPPRKAGYGLIYDYSETHTEKQSMAFSADGVVKTSDGRTINFSVALSMSREYQSSLQIHVRAGDAKIDPLVINLSGAAPQLSQQKDFRFDIDGDGDEDQISRLLAGSGFLALDKNGDGRINDGKELFGPASGDGFAELKTYDADGNGWIDENDPVYDRLRIWEDDGQGNMRLIALGEAGVGALYLGNVLSSFDIKDMHNNSLGTIQSAGVYLKEDGGAGTVQHVDFTL